MAEATVLGRVIGLYLGAVETPWPGKPPSAISKSAAPDGSAFLGVIGFEGDAQADLSVHGGPDKAAHQYPAEHHRWFADAYAGSESAAAFRPGGVGENIASEGLDEAEVCIGDRLALGGAEVEISQGRQPCWKLDAHTGAAALAAQFRKTGRTGWYYRVTAPGLVSVGDRIELRARPQPDWPLSRAAGVLFDPRASLEDVSALAALPELAEAWREQLSTRLA